MFHDCGLGTPIKILKFARTIRLIRDLDPFSSFPLENGKKIRATLNDILMTKRIDFGSKNSGLRLLYPLDLSLLLSTYFPVMGFKVPYSRDLMESS